MARRTHQHATSDRLLPAAVVVLLVGSFVPGRFLVPVSWAGDLVGMIAAPVSQPLRTVGGWLSPPSAGQSESEELAPLHRQIEEYKTLYERARERNSDLLSQMEQLKLMIELNPSVSTRLLNAPVIGSSADTASAQLKIRAGTKQGVHQNDVVAVEGVQLFGAVRDASARTSWIMPITAKAQGHIQGKVMIEDGRGVACSLKSVGDGTLRGDVAYDEDDPEAVSLIEVGQTVRLDDGQWPASAQMLVLGLVESVEPAPDSPLRPVIVVRPIIVLERVTEVIVRINPMPDESDEGGGS
jgi:cell shape-determining protein MreC